jgi:hypothetical protein
MERGFLKVTGPVSTDEDIISNIVNASMDKYMSNLVSPAHDIIFTF